MFLKSWQISKENTCEKKLQHRWFPEKFVKYLRTLILKNICERLLPYFYYNFHHHYHHHHFHYHCKMHLYYLRIHLPIPLDCKIIPCLLVKFCLLPSGIYFSLVLFQGFCSLRPVKGLIIRLEPADRFYVRCSLCTYIYIYSYLHFLIYTLLILIYTYLFILLFFLYYYVNLINC